MSLLVFHRVLTRYACSQNTYSSLIAKRAAAIRQYSTDEDKSQRTGDDKSEGASESMFSPNNIKDMSPVEVARMRVTYGLVKEHVEALEKGLPGIDPETNPLIDPRSFELRKLPRLPDEVLQHFRSEIPAEIAAVSKPVHTYGVWEAIRNGEDHELLQETSETTAAGWDSVDERTMDSRTLARMRRQAVAGHAAPPETRQQPTFTVGQPQQRRKTKACPLKDERGKVKVDFRAVGTLTAFLSDDLKILPRRKSGLCAKSQRKLSKAVKTARTMALINPEPKPRLTVEEMLEMEKNLP